MASADITHEYRGLGVTDFEARIRRSELEVAAIIDPVDGVIRARQGTEHDIEWDDSDCELIPGRIVSHNHPLGDSFSPEDVRLAWEFGAAQLRAVTPDGATYVLGAPARGWGDYSWDEIARVAETWADSVFRDLDEDRLTTSTPMDVILKEVAARLDLSYSRQ